MSYRKNTNNFSSRSKRRRVQEEVKKFVEIPNNIASTSDIFIEPLITNTIENIDSDQQLITNNHITNDVEDSEFIPQLIHSLSSEEDDDDDDDDLTYLNDIFDEVSLFRSLLRLLHLTYLKMH